MTGVQTCALPIFGGAIRLDEDSIIWIHDRLSRESDTFELWDREGRGSEYAAWRNTLEASYSQQLHPDWSGQAVYAHENKWVEDSEYDYENFVSDEIDANVLWAATPKLRLGPYGRYEWLRFE